MSSSPWTNEFASYSRNLGLIRPLASPTVQSKGWLANAERNDKYIAWILLHSGTIEIRTRATIKDDEGKSVNAYDTIRARSLNASKVQNDGYGRPEVDGEDKNNRRRYHGAKRQAQHATLLVAAFQLVKANLTP